MSRPAKKFSDPKKQAAHERKLAKRRENHRLRRTIEMAGEAAEGEADFAELVEAEKQRQENLRQTISRKGGATSPKIMSQAREDLALAFDLMGGVPALVVWGRTNPTDFYRLWAKLIPSTAAQESAAMPLEELLEKLASREEMSVMDAARSIGEETLNSAREQVIREDAQALEHLKTEGNA